MSIYVPIPSKYLGLGFEFEFWPQRIRDLAIVCPYSVCGDINWTRSQLYKFQSQIFVGFDVRSAIKVILNKCCGEQARR